MSQIRDMFFQGLVTDAGIKKERQARRQQYIFESVHHTLLPVYEQDGWIEHKKHKTVSRVRKPKPLDMAFEDHVWVILADMGFDYMSSGRFFKLPYSDDYSLTQQVDIVAIDDESILIVECKAAESPMKTRSFKEPIEAIGGKKEGIIATIRKVFPGSKHKVKFIFATKDYVLPKPDIERLRNFDIAHFAEDEIEYYTDLTAHLGPAAKYQLLGSIFEGQKIPQMDNKVPAIKGKLGPHTYYSFSVEPKRLLKIGYVLHRTKANKELMPTYQRLVKRDRLRAIEKFISQGGFFPNSVILNIDTKRPLQFSPANTQCEDTSCRIGILSLPQKYRSAFIIDGQHRVYGYANTASKATDTIPVVAFENLERSEQVELFMQINENQKQVQKSLRHTLNADLLWNSDNLNEAVKALKLRVAQELGENRASPLHGRVLVGENKKSPITCITIDTIYTALNRSNFFGSVTKDSIKEIGTFYDSNVDSTFEKLFNYLVLCLDYIKDNLPDEWQKGESDDGCLTINPTIYCLVVILSDIVDHLVTVEGVNPRSQSTEALIDDTKPYLDPVIRHFRALDFDGRSNFRRSYGTGGKTTSWRTLQQVIHEARSEFEPQGLEQHMADSSKQFNTRSFEIIRDIETCLKSDIKQRLESEYGQKNWWKKGVPLAVYEDAELLTSKKNREIEDPAQEVDPWDQLHLIDYRKIILHNWRKLFEQKYAYPGTKGDKQEKTKWIVKLEKIRNQNFHIYSVAGEEFAFLQELREWVLSSD